MGVGDGTVIGATKILDNGPDGDRFNVAILAEGYQQGDLSQFASDAQAFVQHLRATPPFDTLGPAINVYRVDVSSTDRGADDPVAAGGTGATANTFFDATFGNGGNRRGLVVNNGTAIQVANQNVPAWHMLMVLVNSTIYGGTGGSVAVFSLAANANEIGVHEMGHTAFGLADEYEYWAGCGVDTDRNRHPNSEPAEPNVTVASTRDSIKWRDLIASGTAIPTMSNPNCSNCDSRASSVPIGTVGAFEGAHYYHCGAYRPEYNCKMRALGQPFCAVCRRVIEQKLNPFLATHWHLGRLTQATGGPLASSDPCAYVFDAQATQHAVYVGSGHMQELWWDAANGWHIEDLSAATGAPAPSGTPCGYTFAAQSTQHVFYRGSNGKVYELWWDAANGWHIEDLSAATGAPLAVGDPSAYVFNAQGTQHVLFRDGDGHVRELWWDAGGGWHLEDLSIATGAPPAAGNPCGYVFDAQGTQHVVFRDGAGHIRELWWDAASGWHLEDLTAATGAPLSSSDPTAYVFSAQSTQHVIFRSADGHIHELWWDAGAGWHHGDLSAATSAPIASSAPAAYVFDAQGSQHVIYRGSDNRIHELWWDTAAGWHIEDLSLATGAPPAAGDPTGYVFAAQNTQHIIYRSSGGEVVELWWG